MRHTSPTWLIYASGHSRGMEPVTMKALQFVDMLLWSMRLRIAGYKKIKVRHGPDKEV